MKMPAEECAVDANVVLRHLIPDDPRLSERATAIFRAAEDGGVVLHLDPVNLAEVVWVMRSFYQVAPAEIAYHLSALLAMPGLVIPDKTRYLHALALYGDSVRDFGDACAAACAHAQCEGRIISFDRRLSAVPGLDRREQV